MTWLLETSFHVFTLAFCANSKHQGKKTEKKIDLRVLFLLVIVGHKNMSWRAVTTDSARQSPQQQHQYTSSQHQGGGREGKAGSSNLHERGGDPMPVEQQRKELDDALESLQSARLQHHKLMTDLKKQQRSIEETRRADDLTPAGTFRATQDATHALLAQTEKLKQTLDEEQAKAHHNTTVIQAEVGGMKGQVHGLRFQLDRLRDTVKVMDEGCRVAETEVRSLRSNLERAKKEKELLVAGLQELMANTKKSSQRVRMEMERQDVELRRLNEQNGYLRMQILGREMQKKKTL